jgi:transcription elongation GreA/GreB family factor
VTSSATTGELHAPLPFASEQPTLEFPCLAGLGSTVEAEDVATGFRLTYRLVDPYAAAPNAGLLSVESPVGAALVGRCAGEVATAATPRGERRLRVLAVS